MDKNLRMLPSRPNSSITPNKPPTDNPGQSSLGPTTRTSHETWKMASAKANATMADIVAHAEHVKRKVAAQPNSRQAFVAAALLNEGTDEVVPDRAQKRVPHIVPVVV